MNERLFNTVRFLTASMLAWLNIYIFFHSNHYWLFAIGWFVCSMLAMIYFIQIFYPNHFGKVLRNRVRQDKAEQISEQRLLVGYIKPFQLTSKRLSKQQHSQN